MELERESQRWVEAGIIDPGQRARILELYPAGEARRSMATLALVWAGGVLVFLGLAFLLGIVWDDLGPLRPLVVGGGDAAFFAGGAWLRRRRPTLERTALTLQLIGALLFPAALGVTWEELFGSSGHILPLLVPCVLLYAAMAARLTSRAFVWLLALSLFWVGEEVIRDQETFGALFPLVQLGLVRSLEDVFPLVFIQLGGALALAAVAAGYAPRFARLRAALLSSGYVLAILPALAGGIWPRSTRHLNLALAHLTCLAAMGLAVALRQRAAFWVGGAGLFGALFILFADVFENSILFTVFAIGLGLAILILGATLASRRDTWFDRLFAEQAPAAVEAALPVTAEEPPDPGDLVAGSEAGAD